MGGAGGAPASVIWRGRGFGPRTLGEGHGKRKMRELENGREDGALALAILDPRPEGRPVARQR